LSLHFFRIVVVLYLVKCKAWFENEKRLQVLGDSEFDLDSLRDDLKGSLYDAMRMVEREKTHTELKT